MICQATIGNRGPEAASVSELGLSGDWRRRLGKKHDCAVLFCRPESRYNEQVRRWIAVAAFSFILFSLPLWAQRHGGGGGSHAASGGGFGSHSAGSFHSGGFSRGSGIGSGFRVGSSYNHIRDNRGLYGRRSYYPYRYYPYGGYYGWYDPLWSDDGYQSDDYQSGGATQDVYAQVPYREDGGLQRDVQNLSGKIDRLQADVEARNRPKVEEPETALVFRDQHVEEVRNYAIACETLWVLNDQAAKKIPLAKLDIPATVKMNDDRGVDFEIPK